MAVVSSFGCAAVSAAVQTDEAEGRPGLRRARSQPRFRSWEGPPRSQRLGSRWSLLVVHEKVVDVVCVASRTCSFGEDEVSGGGVGAFLGMRKEEGAVRAVVALAFSIFGRCA